MKKFFIYAMMSLLVLSCSNDETYDVISQASKDVSNIEQNNKDSELIQNLQTYNQGMPQVVNTRGFWGGRLWRFIKADVYATPECLVESGSVEAGIAVAANSTSSTRFAFVISLFKGAIKIAQKSFKAYKKNDCAGLSAVLIRNEYLYNVSTHCSHASEMDFVVQNMDSLITNMNTNSFINDTLPVLMGNIHNLYLDYAMNPSILIIPLSNGGNEINGHGLTPIIDDPVLVPDNNYGVPNLSNEEIESFISLGDTDSIPDFDLYGDETALQNLCNANVISQSTVDVMTLFYEALENINSESALYSLINYYIGEVNSSYSLSQTEKNEIVLQLEVFRHSYDFWKIYITN